ncbi:hypothetical protein GCM10011316_21040 [Roseibium aquae]|uniref:DUF4440 domain-containing protein n=1 Tax=Roseibium aquae TaxID=1323746 RepID=A0A916TKY4_9HYPH|nr:hypothetical protein [Roseibium aquae]GGB48714.1 hypothetical protein GCM10011316_21040 [Roseibium aquae]
MSEDNDHSSAQNGSANGAGPDNGTGAEEAIAALFDDYKTGFDDYEADRICDCFTLPVVIWQQEKGHVFADADELMENIEALLSVLDKEGIVQSDFHVSSSHISGTSAMVTLDWQQSNGDGEIVTDFTCHYHLLQDGADWGIAMVVNE